MDAPDPRIHWGRTAVVVGVVLALVLTVFIKVVFEGPEPESDVLVNFIIALFGLCALAFLVVGIGGPIAWGLGLRAAEQPWWPAALMLAVFITATVVLTIWLLDGLFEGLGAPLF